MGKPAGADHPELNNGAVRTSGKVIIFNWVIARVISVICVAWLFFAFLLLYGRQQRTPSPAGPSLLQFTEQHYQIGCEELREKLTGDGNIENPKIILPRRSRNAGPNSSSDQTCSGCRSTLPTAEVNLRPNGAPYRTYRDCQEAGHSRRQLACNRNEDSKKNPFAACAVAMLMNPLPPIYLRSLAKRARDLRDIVFPVPKGREQEGNVDKSSALC